MEYISSVEQWWLNFLSYIQLYKMPNDQALNILPFFCTEPNTGLISFNRLRAFFARYREIKEDIDLDDINQGIDKI